MEKVSKEQILINTKPSLIQSHVDFNNLLYVLSHDLTSFLISNEGLLFPILNQLKHKSLEIEKDIELVKSEFKALQDLSKKLIEYSRLSTRGTPKTIIDLDCLLLNVTKLFLNLNIEITGYSKVKVDPIHIEQLVIELLKNAQIIKQKDFKIKFNIVSDCKNNRTFLYYEDNGKGLPYEELLEYKTVLNKKNKNNSYCFGFARIERICNLNRIDFYYQPATKGLKLFFIFVN